MFIIFTSQKGLPGDFFRAATASSHIPAPWTRHAQGPLETRRGGQHTLLSQPPSQDARGAKRAGGGVEFLGLPCRHHVVSLAPPERTALMAREFNPRPLAENILHASGGAWADLDAYD